MTAQSTRLVVLVAALSVGIPFGVRAEPQGLTSVFTPEQTILGQTTYEAYCMACHQADLGGQNEALPLKGTPFYTSWMKRTSRDLFAFISTSMPPGQAVLSEREYLGLVAFLLQSNGATPGATPLTATTSVPIRFVVPQPRREP